MSRQKKEKFDLSKLRLNRTVGLEIEGYMKRNPRRLLDEGGIRDCDIKRDGSLRNYHWRDNNGMYGVEVVTTPLRELSTLDAVFEKILAQGWSASGRASLHIHVDARDYTYRDRLKMLHFCKRIEDVMLLFVKNRRYNNRYCRLIPAVYGTILNDSRMDKVTSWTELNVEFNRLRREEANRLYIDRYHWCNAMNSHHNTIEFRLFHPVRSSEESGKFAFMVHQLVDLVKSASIEQLEFIATRIEQEPSVKAKATMLLQALHCPFDLPILSERAIEAINRKQMDSNRTVVV